MNRRDDLTLLHVSQQDTPLLNNRLQNYLLISIEGMKETLSGHIKWNLSGSGVRTHLLEGQLFSSKLGLGIRAGMLPKWDKFYTEETAFERILYEGEIDTC